MNKLAYKAHYKRLTDILEKHGHTDLYVVCRSIEPVLGEPETYTAIVGTDEWRTWDIYYSLSTGEIFEI